MKKTRVIYHRDYQIAPVDKRIFGGFLEHLGRAVYEGVYDPKSAHADEDGFRTDVLQALDAMRYTAMRYPGGNFASGYHWMHGIGPREKRPVVRDLAWQSTEPNQFGTDEFIKLSRKLDWTPMITVNLGTGTPEEASNWVEYCNSPAGTMFSDQRAANGSSEPFHVKLWCLGNEMDGIWQIGHVPADQYAIRAQQAAKQMKDTDPSIELVASGSCGPGMATYMDWDRTVLEYLGEFADYISMHRYVGNSNGNTADYLAVTNAIDRQIEEMDAVCRYEQARARRKKRAYLSFDEWNVWYRTTKPEYMDGRGQFAPHLIEEEYNLEDALVVAGFLNSFIRHADSVKIANLAQIVNVIAPIHTRGNDMLLHSIYYPFLMYARRRDGVALKPSLKGPGYESPNYGYVNYIDASAILGEGVLHAFLANRSTSESAAVSVECAGYEFQSVQSAEILTGPGANASNSFEQPNTVCNQALESIDLQDGIANFQLPPLSVAAATFVIR